MVQEENNLQLWSTVLGWTYFLAWSISFYQQPWLNFKRASVRGLSAEFLFYNVTGFLFYSTYTIAKYVLQKNLGLPLSVQPNDIAFAVHAEVLCVLTLLQFIWYRWKAGQSLCDLSPLHSAILAALWLLAFAHVALALIAPAWLPWYFLPRSDSPESAGYAYNLLDFLGFAKTTISFIKYVPQVLLNYRLQSTRGWAIGNVLLDATGGICAFLQQTLDAISANDFSIFTSNPAKLILSCESLCFDLIFLVQHFLLYAHARDAAVSRTDNGEESVHSESASLLEAGSSGPAAGERATAKGYGSASAR